MPWSSCCALLVADGAIARFRMRWCILGPRTPARWGGKPLASSMACSLDMSPSSMSSENMAAAAAAAPAPAPAPPSPGRPPGADAPADAPPEGKKKAEDSH